MTLHPTSTSVATQTTYMVPDNTILIDDDTSSARIRPTSVIVNEKDGKIESFAYAGPRQAGPLASWTGDSRDSGSAVIQLNQLGLSDDTEELLHETMMLHLRSTVRVLNDDETREVLANLTGLDVITD